MKLLSKSYIEKFTVGEVITIEIAHLWQHGYWQSYSSHEYVVEFISRKYIMGRNNKHNDEIIAVTRKDLDTGRFRIPQK